MLGFPLSAIAGFSADGRVFRAFDHLIGARMGELLLVPMALAVGDLRGVVDACPVPWGEVWSVIDSEPRQPLSLAPRLFRREQPQLAAWSDTGWTLDFITLGAAERPLVPRLTHGSGLRFAKVG